MYSHCSTQRSLLFCILHSWFSIVCLVAPRLPFSPVTNKPVITWATGFALHTHTHVSVTAERVRNMTVTWTHTPSWCNCKHCHQWCSHYERSGTSLEPWFWTPATLRSVKTFPPVVMATRRCGRCNVCLLQKRVCRICVGASCTRGLRQSEASRARIWFVTSWFECCGGMRRIWCQL